MTFEELTKLITAVRADKLAISYLPASLEMTITPEYGVDNSVADKKFHLSFNSCIFVGSLFSGRLKIDKGQEFISWGIEVLDDAKKEALLTVMYQTNGPGSINKDNFPSILKSYFFENAFGDSLRIVCSEVVVTEVNSSE